MDIDCLEEGAGIHIRHRVGTDRQHPEVVKGFVDLLFIVQEARPPVAVQPGNVTADPETQVSIRQALVMSPPPT